MSGFVVVILFGINFVLFPCEGKIIEPPGGDSLLVESGLNVTIAWSFDDNISDVSFRSWSFTRGSSTTGDTLATISGDDEHKIKSTRFPFVISKPGTLILTNVDPRYDGTYKFTLIASKTVSSDVTVDVAVKPTAKVCSNPITVDEGENITCLCTGKGGNPPANVTWYDKDDKQIGVAGNEEQLLTLSNVDKTDSGIYKCVAQSYTLTEEKSIEVKVRPNFAPVVISLTSEPETAALGESVTITCKADGRPPPSYAIIHNDTITVSTEETYTKNDVVYSDAGSYKCIAKNKLGNSSRNYIFSVVASGPTTIPSSTTTTKKVKPTTKGNETDVKAGKGSDDFPVGAIVGIVIGVLVLLVVVLVLAWWCKNKDKDRHRGNAIVNSGNNDPANVYESVSDGGKAGGDKAGGSTSGNPPANANQPSVYATVDKNRKNEPAVTYATLDTMAMQPNGSKRENEPPRAQTEYASIQFEGLKGDLV